MEANEATIRKQRDRKTRFQLRTIFVHFGAAIQKMVFVFLIAALAHASQHILWG